jgi:IS605 OrfB family transposase
MESIKTYTDQIDFWHWSGLSALSNLVDIARHYCLELIIEGKSKLQCNKELQAKFNINKRWSNSIYTEVQAIVSNINENRANHIQMLSGEIKSIKSDINKRTKEIKEFASSEKEKTGFSQIKKACNINAKQRQSTQLQDAKFGLHQKKRRLHLLEKQLGHLNSTKPTYVLPKNNGFMLVGSKDESSGNQSAQFDYIERTDKFVLSIRTPYALSDKLGGSYIRIDGLNFKHGKHELIESISPRCYKVRTQKKTEKEKWAVGYNAVTLRFYWKNDCWYVAASTDVHLPDITSEYLSGYVGVDLNADSIGWAVCDPQGNLREYGDYKLDLHCKTSNQRAAILSEAAVFIALKAKQYNYPIASEELDFSAKKKQLREKGKKYARMLSYYAYSQWNEVLDNACEKYGIYHKKVNPAYSSTIGLTKFMSIYGMNSASAAAFVIARRGRRFSERLPKKHHLLPSRSAYTKVTKVKHVWSHWSKVSKSTKCTPRHKYFSARFNRTRKVTSFCQLTCILGEPRLLDNSILLELFVHEVFPKGDWCESSGKWSGSRCRS